MFPSLRSVNEWMFGDKNNQTCHPPFALAPQKGCFFYSLEPIPLKGCCFYSLAHHQQRPRNDKTLRRKIQTGRIVNSTRDAYQNHGNNNKRDLFRSMTHHINIYGVFGSYVLFGLFYYTSVRGLIATMRNAQLRSGLVLTENRLWMKQ